MKTRKIYTRVPYIFRSIRLPREDLQLWQAAATKLGVSQSAFLRRAIHGKATQVLKKQKERDG